MVSRPPLPFCADCYPVPPVCSGCATGLDWSALLRFVRFPVRSPVRFPVYGWGGGGVRLWAVAWIAAGMLAPGVALAVPEALLGRGEGGQGGQQPRQTVAPGPVLAQGRPQGATNAAAEWLERGIEHITQGQIEPAIAAFQRAISLNPNLTPAHYNLGLAYRQTGQLQNAINSFYQATRTDPSFALAASNLGAALLEGGNLEESSYFLRRAIELEPGLGLAHYNLGLLQQKQGRWAGAVRSLREATRLSPAAPEPFYQLGLSYQQQNQLQAAQQAFEQAIALTSRYAEALYSLGSIYYQQQNFEAALDAFLRAAQADPTYAHAYYSGGLVFLIQGKPTDAATLFQYAYDLYQQQNNPTWAAQAAQSLRQARQQVNR
ncbi:MAG: tetratricopeptide repeat protein [Prochlorothrix sp.]|nr:tetratricopeptide repeat protein [Prochlorothrix sp.]